MISDRRTLLRSLGGLGLLALTGSCSQLSSDGTTTSATSASAASTATPSASQGSCAAVTGTSAGPYHLSYDTVRKNIVGDREGVPLELYVAIVRSGACTAIRNAAVEIWHCDAEGLYSGYTDVSPADNTESTGATSAEATDDTTFLRGIQMTDKTGTAHFVSIYPGWVANRAPHVYVRVTTGGTTTGSTYSGGKVLYTGQVFLPDATTAKVAATSPYTENDTKRIALTADAAYKKVETSLTLKISARKGTTKVSDGYIGVVVLRVDA